MDGRTEGRTRKTHNAATRMAAR